MGKGQSKLACRFLGHQLISTDQLGNVVVSGSINEEDEILTCARCRSTDYDVLRWVGYLPATLAGILLTFVLCIPLLVTFLLGGFDRR
jgi:hypothetical protein